MGTESRKKRGCEFGSPLYTSKESGAWENKRLDVFAECTSERAKSRGEFWTRTTNVAVTGPWRVLKAVGVDGVL